MPKLTAILLVGVALAAPTIALADAATLCAPFKSAWASKGRNAPGIPAVCVSYFGKAQPTHAASTPAPPAKTHVATPPVHPPPQRVASAPPPAPPEPDLGLAAEAPSTESPEPFDAAGGGRRTPWAAARAAMAAQDYPAAMTYFKQAAARGNIAAEVNIGMLYANGLGAPQDYAQAMSWYQQAAAQGNPRAEWSIGVLYARGLGVPHDAAQALSWYLKAAAAGNHAAEYAVGLFYLNGRAGLTADVAQARSWFVRAASGGNADAQAWLAAHPN
jgi:hypothetical protein